VKLTSVTLPDDITNIGYGAFSHCTSLTSIVIPDSVIDLGLYMFWGCMNLTSVTIGSGVSVIEEGLFSELENLTTITFRNITPPTINEESFGNILLDWTIPQNLKTIYVPCATFSAYSARVQSNSILSQLNPNIIETHMPSNTWIDSATCTAGGYRVKRCLVSSCNEILQQEWQTSLGHDFPATWTIERTATCTLDGEEKRTCQRDCGLLGHTETRSITTRPPHTPTANWTSGNPANCTTASTRIKTCTVSGCNQTVETENQQALGHDFPATWTIERTATCLLDGEEKRVCTRACGLSGHIETRPTTKDGIFRISVVNVEGHNLIEIRNTSDSAVSTKGLYISNDDDLFKWQMQSFIIRAGQTIIINDININPVSVPILKRAKVNFDVTSAEMLRLTAADETPIRCWSNTGECFCVV
jgi:hypothetical protein